MIMQAERLGYRYKGVERQWDTKVEVPIHEFLDFADHHDCVSRMKQAVLDFPPEV
jgi:hypothetical protein